MIREKNEWLSTVAKRSAAERLAEVMRSPAVLLGYECHSGMDGARREAARRQGIRKMTWLREAERPY
ncbi:hypothetical protein LPTSP4_36140 [Leptospira ryugenii]|uniref:Uncharacterized protein n=1 Tax=Leptospira ryugenii TaxID=1917863 RepID=A0A2P2E5D4_9LEPT|nr:hypothetical protein LPTSP4_36140 [Leptospira ryugenii]